jgi:hypothetical protein
MLTAGDLTRQAQQAPRSSVVILDGDRPAAAQLATRRTGQGSAPLSCATAGMDPVTSTRTL